MQLPDKKTIKGHTVSRERRFSGRTYITDFKSYQSKINAKAVVLYLKTKELSVLARVIDKEDFILVYFDKNTYNDIRYDHIQIPELKDIPEDFFEMAADRLKIKRKHPKQRWRREDQEWQRKQLDRFQRKKREGFEVIKLKKEVSTAELMESASDDEEYEEQEESDEVTEGINAALNHVEKEFFKSCPKCGFEMKPTFMIVGGKNRISIYQCVSCKFYIPRRL